MKTKTPTSSLWLSAADAARRLTDEGRAQQENVKFSPKSALLYGAALTKRPLVRYIVQIDIFENLSDAFIARAFAIKG